jgi:hypothetical protein
MLVIRNFKDLQDNGHVYSKGDAYPREGYEPSPERVEQLLKGKNKNKKIYLEEVENKEVESNEEVESESDSDEYPKQTKEGSPWYVLSNGEKVQGKDAAAKAEEELKAGE